MLDLAPSLFKAFLNLLYRWPIFTPLLACHLTRRSIPVRSIGLLTMEAHCLACGTQMYEGASSRKVDRKVWRCPVKECRHVLNLRAGSFFDKSRAELHQLCLITYFYSTQTPAHQIQKEAKVSQDTVVDWSNFIREVFVSFKSVLSKQLCFDCFD